MRPRWALLIYIVLVVLGAALLAPWLYKFAHAPAGDILKLDDKPLGFFVINAILILALAASWLLFRSQGVKSFRDAGLVNPWTERNKIMGGFLLGFVSLSVVAVLAIGTGSRDFKQDMAIGRLAERLVGAMLTAWGVAVMEEILFRGAIFGAIRKAFGWKLALVLSSAIYSIMHFMESPAWAGDVTWLSGFQILPDVMRRILSGENLIPGFFNLALAGALLALAYQRTGNLCFSIGVHAGWIFWIKSYITFTTGDNSKHVWFYGTNKMYNGWLAFFVLAGALIVFTRLQVARKRSDHKT